MKIRDYSNYHEVTVEEKMLHDSSKIVEMALNGYDSQSALIDGAESRILLKSKFNNVDGMGKYIYGRPDEINRGSVVLTSEESWLVVTLPENYRTYKKAMIYLCNNEFSLAGKDEKILLGYNKLKEPQYKIIKGESTSHPCYISVSAPSFTDGKPINVPDSDLSITMPYKVHSDLEEGKIHEFYGQNYQFVGIDRTKVINEKGILIIYAKRMVNS
ncbi:hypothetical protein SAMN05421503_1429 [Terribacillus aidingensis]|uniref:Uncharacterized protein n=1 Tax=Terribacillus aidingensis TaxID=586416 RepID=A0A285NQN9_9BACI|nr:hypothetical protein [Terribacillus aidingensis]SNZ09941.1 hypothetical protein SAMN05421503_1429 [Terribacillus aidingensis]